MRRSCGSPFGRRRFECASPPDILAPRHQDSSPGPLTEERVPTDHRPHGDDQLEALHPRYARRCRLQGDGLRRGAAALVGVERVDCAQLVGGQLEVEDIEASRRCRCALVDFVMTERPCSMCQRSRLRVQRPGLGCVRRQRTAGSPLGILVVWRPDSPGGGSYYERVRLVRGWLRGRGVVAAHFPSREVVEVQILASAPYVYPRRSVALPRVRTARPSGPRLASSAHLSKPESRARKPPRIG